MQAAGIFLFWCVACLVVGYLLGVCKRCSRL